MIYLTRRERFSAAHRLARPDWSDEKNAEVFGKCSNRNWHGHNYVLFVTVKGEIDPETGFVTDLKKISEIIKAEVIEHVDHKNINIDTPFTQGVLASTENLTIAIWNQLVAPFEAIGCTLHKVKLEETENNFVEYYGEA